MEDDLPILLPLPLPRGFQLFPDVVVRLLLTFDEKAGSVLTTFKWLSSEKRFEFDLSLLNKEVRGVFLCVCSVDVWVACTSRGRAGGAWTSSC